jgi:hypothetical protein
MVVMMMVVVRPENATERATDDVMMMVVVMVSENLRHLRVTRRGIRLLRQLGVIRLQRLHRIRHRVEQIPIRSRRLGRLCRGRRVCGSDGRQGGCRAEKTRYSLVHISSKGLATFQTPQPTILGGRLGSGAGIEFG